MYSKCDDFGIQQRLPLQLPSAPALARSEWRTMAAMAMNRRHQKFSRSSRAEMTRFYKQIFSDERACIDCPPIA